MTTAKKPAAKKTAAKKPVAKKTVAKKTVAPTYDFKKPYKMLTGIDDSAFCDKVSAHLNAGYVLVGGAAATFNGKNVIVAQAVTKPSNIVKAKKK
jgi:hypothetical protein